jgi:coiled-coil domain-containing protein 55
MLIGQKGVKYGLQVRQPAGKPAAAPPPKKASVFGEDDSDDEQPTVEQQIARQAARKQTDKRVRDPDFFYFRSICATPLTAAAARSGTISFTARLLTSPPPARPTQVAEMHAAALAEDSSIFEYDAHHDSIQEARAEPKRQEKMARQSRYIGGLLEKAEERKREQDVLYERQLAKERAAEDHLFGDKERFVTAAYRKKLEEDAKFNEEQRRMWVPFALLGRQRGVWLPCLVCLLPSNAR